MSVRVETTEKKVVTYASVVRADNPIDPERPLYFVDWLYWLAGGREPRWSSEHDRARRFNDVAEASAVAAEIEEDGPDCLLEPALACEHRP